ncbi:hypothetical protein PM082_009269 [Marasmius tenuissimus]|nr:hypothetical protein PM082_009269 [Marasmius tenuissimus]
MPATNLPSTENYQLIHRYQLLRAVDPTTTNFARPLGYDFTFQPVSDKNRFAEAYEEQGSCHPNAPDGPFRSSGSGSSLDAHGHEPVSIVKGRIVGGKEACHHLDQNLRHINDTSTIDQTMEEQGLQYLRPPPTTSLLCAGALNLHSLEYTHLRQMHQSQVHLHGYDDNQRRFPYPYLSQNSSSGYPSLSTLNTPAPMNFNSPSMGRTLAGWPGIPQYIPTNPPFDTARHGEDIAQRLAWPPGTSYVASPAVANTFYNHFPGTVTPTQLGRPQFGMTIGDPLVASSSCISGSPNLDNRSSAIMPNPVYTNPMGVCSPTNAAQSVGQSGLARVDLAGSNIVDDANIGPPGDSRGVSRHEERTKPPCSLLTSANRTGGIVDGAVRWTNPACVHPNFFPSFVTFLQTCMYINAL